MKFRVINKFKVSKFSSYSEALKNANGGTIYFKVYSQIWKK